MTTVTAVRRAGAVLRGTGGSVLTAGGLQLIVAASGIIAARLLGVTNRGHLALLWVVTAAAGQLMSFGLHVGISYEVAGGRTPLQVCGRLRGLIAAQLAGATVLGFVLEFALFGSERAQSTAALLAAAMVPPLFILLLHGLALAQGQRKYHLVQLHRLVQPSLYVVVLVGLAASSEGRLTTVTAGWAATMAAGALFAWRQGLGAWWPPAPAVTDTAEEGSPRAVLRFSLRSMFSSFGAVEHFQADVLLVGLLVSAQQFGLYAAGAAFANLPEFLGQSVGYIAYPEVRSTAPDRQARAVRRYLAIGALVVVPVVLVLLAILGWLLPFLFGHDFNGAVTIGRLLLIAALAQGLRRVAAESLRGLGSSAAATIAELSFIVVFVAAVVPLANAHGSKGAALGLVIASVFGAAVLLALALRRRSEAR